MIALDIGEAVREIQQAIVYLEAQDHVAGSQVGIVGFCSFCDHLGGQLMPM